MATELNDFLDKNNPKLHTFVCDDNVINFEYVTIKRTLLCFNFVKHKYKLNYKSANGNSVDVLLNHTSSYGDAITFDGWFKGVYYNLEIRDITTYDITSNDKFMILFKTGAHPNHTRLKCGTFWLIVK